MKTIKLNNRVEMPQIGLGTFLIPKDKLSYAIKEAYDLGYRQFDTAWRYHNEKEIGLALKEHGIKREDVFITTKVNADALYFKDYKYGRHRIFNINVSSTNLEQSKLCVNSPLYIDTRLLWEQTIGSNSTQ